MHTARNKRSAAQREHSARRTCSLDLHFCIAAMWIFLSLYSLFAKVARCFATPHSLARPAATMHSPYALNDVFFARALASLPATLLEAMHAAVLTYAGASAAVLAAKAASSCHEPRLVDPSVVSSFVSASVSLPVSPADGHPASNAPDSTALPIESAFFSTTEVEKEAADGHPAPNAPDHSGIPAQTDSASTATLKNRDFHCDSARFQRISQKSRILEKVRESPPVSGLSNLDGCPPIKLVRESVAQFLHAVLIKWLSRGQHSVGIGPEQRERCRRIYGHTG